MKRGRREEHSNHERWLVSYADFITLLFAFFVVMFALSMENMAKVKAAAESIRQAFGEPGHGARLVGQSDGSAINPFDGPGAGAPRAPSASDPELNQVKSLFDETLNLDVGNPDLPERLETLYDSRGLVVRLSAEGFFGDGEPGVRADFHPLLDRIGRILVNTKRPFRIEGHADASEASPRGFASDWELSAARAAWVARYWVTKFGLSPERMGVAGYGHYRPLKTGKNEWTRGLNRRIEIVVLSGALSQ